jgi:ABC-2 type transport system permease protein
LVRHFVRLKLRLLSNRLRTQSVLGKIGYAAVWAAGVVLGTLGGLAVFGLSRLTDQPGAILIIAYTVLFLGWMIIPAAISALDETLDPRRFELLPITPRRLTFGLLAAGAVSPGSVGTGIALAIGTFGSFPDWSLAPVILVAVAVELAMCLVIARLVTTVLANLLASRRTRELATLAFGIMVGVVGFLPAFLSGSDDVGSPDIEITITSLDWLESLIWLPPGAVAGSIGRAAEGDILGGVGLAIYGFAATAAMGALWARSVRSMLVKAPTGSRSTRRRENHDRALAISPSWLRLPSGAVAGVVAKELRYLVRDNRIRAQLIGSVIPILVIAVVTNQSYSDTPYAPFLAAGLAFLIALGILANQFGVDGGSFWGYLVSSTPLSTVVVGKNIGWGLIALPPVLVGAAALAWRGGDFSYVAAAVFGSAGVLFVSAAVGNITSIYGAFPIPESNPFGTRGGSSKAFFPVIIGMMASGALLVPIAAFIALPAAFLGAAAATMGALLSIGYGVLIHRLGMKLTSRLLVERQHLLLDAIDGDTP